MSATVIKQNHDKVMALPQTPSSLSQINAYTDQSLMNMNYETMTDAEYASSYPLIVEMMDRYRAIKKA